MSGYRAAAMFLGLGLLWGGSFPAIEVGLETFPPVLFAAFRYDLAGAVLLVYAVLAADRWRPAGADLAAIGAAGLFLVAGNSLLFVGQQFTTGGVAAVIYSLIPLLTTGFAWVVLPEERHSALGLVGVLLGLLGVGLIVRPDPGNLLAAGVVGKAFVLAAAVSVSVGSVTVRRLDPALGDAPFTAWSLLVGAVLLHAGSLAAGESPAGFDVAAGALAALGYIAVFATALAFLIYFALLGAYGPLEANLVSYVVPVVATLLGWALLDEPVTAWTVGGFALIFGGFVVLKRRALRAELRSLGGPAA